MSKLVIDSHAHAFPDRLKPLAPESVRFPLFELRKRARQWLKPLSSSLHKAQTALRHLPEPARRLLDELSGIVPLPTLIFESTAEDLAESLDRACVDRVLVIAHPPLATNEFVLEACAKDPRLLPVANIPASEPEPAAKLREYAERGAVALKIHPAADGEGPDSPRYAELLKTAEELGLPVIVHTGCIHTHLLYKDPEQGRAQAFEPWFKAHPELRFVLAHMNFHDPAVAMDLMETYPNVYADTSWQPAEVIGEAVRRVGADRVLFGTDWPIVGDNQSVGLERIRDCVESGLITEEQAGQIRGLNAAKLFKIAAN
jgi:predicted TIM-barrel fold metal-dependent hydrolase